jgi:RecB family endonuclease NucS
VHKESLSIGDKLVSESRPLTVLVKPNLIEAEKTIKKAISQHKMIVVVGRCQVDYQGRAGSKLETGERMLIIKEDGSLLIHRSLGYEPVNWQPPRCIFHTHTKENKLEIHSIRHRPEESVKVIFDSVQMVSTMSLKDSGEFSLYASEEDMHKAILARPSLVEDGFKPISYEKKVEPGFVDIYGTDKEGRLVVVEVKRKTASKEAALQLAKYIDAVKLKADREVRGILVAPATAKGVQKLLATLKLEFKALEPKKCAETLRKTRSGRLESYFPKYETRSKGLMSVTPKS